MRVYPFAAHALHLRFKAALDLLAVGADTGKKHGGVLPAEKVLAAEILANQALLEQLLVKRRHGADDDLVENDSFNILAQALNPRALFLVAEGKHRHLHRHSLFYPCAHHRFRLFGRAHLRHRFLFAGNVRIADAFYFCRIHIPANTQHHIGWHIKTFICLVEHLGCDLCDRFHTARNILIHRARVVKRTKQTHHRLPSGIVAVHLNLLPDNALLFSNGLLREIRLRNKIEKRFKVCVEIFRARKQVAGAVKRGVGICPRAGQRKFFKGILFLALKELVLQKVGSARRQAHRFPAGQGKAAVCRTEPGAEKRIARLIIRLRQDKDF